MSEQYEQLTPEEIEEFRALKQRLQAQELRDEGQRDLPEEIHLELEETSRFNLKKKLKQYHRDTIKYEGGKWTQTGTINKVYLPELKRYQCDAAQMVSAIGKGADRLRTAGRRATEIFSELKYIFDEGGDEEALRETLEKVRRLAVYCLATGKEMDNDAKEVSAKAIKLPTSLRYMEEEDDEEGKDCFFSPAEVEKIQRTRFEESVIRKSTTKQFGGFGRGRSNGHNYRGKSFGSSHFFGKSRGRGGSTQKPQQSPDTGNNNSN